MSNNNKNVTKAAKKDVSNAEDVIFDIIKELCKDADTINIINVEHKCENIAKKAVKTIITKIVESEKGDNGGVLKLMLKTLKDIGCDIRYAKSDISVTFTDAYDLVSVVKCVLCKYFGKKMLENGTEKYAQNGKNHKKGEYKTIISEAFGAVNDYIHAERKRVYEECYIDDVVNGAIIRVRRLSGITDAHTYGKLQKYEAELKLTYVQQNVLGKRIDGKGIKEIAREKSVDKRAIKDSLSQVRKKLIAYVNSDDASDELKQSYIDCIINNDKKGL
jgi:hypothetical protein